MAARKAGEIAVPCVIRKSRSRNGGSGALAQGYIFPCGAPTVGKHKCGRGGPDGMNCVGSVLSIYGLDAEAGAPAAMLAETPWAKRPVGELRSLLKEHSRSVGPLVRRGAPLTIMEIRALRKKDCVDLIAANGVGGLK